MRKRSDPGPHAPMFSNPDAWRADPRKAFEDWAINARQTAPNETGPSRPLLRGSSIKVYAAMWSSFVASAEARLVNPFTMGQDDISRFLLEDKAGIGHQHRKRYARVIARALEHAKEGTRGAPKLPRPETKVNDEPTPFLGKVERDQVFALLGQPCFYNNSQEIAHARAKALCALMLGGGLKPGEALNRSSVNCALYVGENTIRIEQLGIPKSRVAYFDPRGRTALASWLAWREKSGGGAFFPSQPGAKKPVADYARAFLGVKKLLAQAGVVAGGERASPQTLRNAYGAALIETGMSIEVIRIYMGFTRLEFAHRFIVAHGKWTQRHADRPT